MVRILNGGFQIALPGRNFILFWRVYMENSPLS